MATLQPLPAPIPDERRAAPPGRPVTPTLPDYLPARMVNEFVYCPRLFFLEWVDGVFRHSADTEEGKQQHQRVDKPDKAGRGLPAAEKLIPAQAEAGAADESAQAEADAADATSGSAERIHS